MIKAESHEALANFKKQYTVHIVLNGAMIIWFAV
jgi:hypothetical protein